MDETSVYADWVECSALFHDDAISKADVKDCFSEIDSFEKENTPSKVADIWSELRRRKRLVGLCYPVSIDENKITAAGWRDNVAYSFCLLLSYAKSNREWERKSCNDYLAHGELFEHVSVAALMYILANWKVKRIGWSIETPDAIRHHIQSIVTELGEQTGSATPRPVDKDGGVDILCYRQFPDRRGNYPVCFVQCATGRNWTRKRGEDALRLWRNWIHFKAPNLLSRGFAVPFVLGDETFRETQIRGDSLILDRIRLFSHDTPESKWLSKDLRTRIESWVAGKLGTFSED
jgi:hypothetical protein